MTQQQQQQQSKALQTLLELCPSAVGSTNHIQTMFPRLHPSAIKNVAFDCGIDVVISVCRSSLLMEDIAQQSCDNNGKRNFVCCRWNEHPLLSGVFRSPWSGLWQRALDPLTTTRETCLEDEEVVNKLVFDAESSKSFLGSTQRLLGSRAEVLREWELSLNDTLRRFVELYYTSAIGGQVPHIKSEVPPIDKRNHERETLVCCCAFVKDVTESAKANALQQLTLTQESMAVIEVQVMIVVEGASEGNKEPSTRRCSLFERDEDWSDTTPVPTPRCVVLHRFLLDFKAPRAGGSTVPTLRMLHDITLRIQNTGATRRALVDGRGSMPTERPVPIEDYIRATFVSAKSNAVRNGHGQFSLSHQWSFRESRRYEGLSHRRLDGKTDGESADDCDADALDPVVQAEQIKLTEHIINAIQVVENGTLQLLIDAAIPMMTSQLGPFDGSNGAEGARLRGEATPFAGARAELSALAATRRPPTSASVV